MDILCEWSLTSLSLLKVKISAPFLIGDFFVPPPPLTIEARTPWRPGESPEPRRLDSVPAEVGVLHL